jgi:hypothetical protein
MRPLGAVRIGVFAIVVAIASSACVSAASPGRPQLRVLQGGAGTPASPIPSITAAPEPPIGVIMAGRVVIGCDFGSRCTYFARLTPVSPEQPDPVAAVPTTTPVRPVTLVGVGAAAPGSAVDETLRGYGPTARGGRPAEQEPVDGASLVAGLWHLDAWTTMVDDTMTTTGRAAGRGSCGLDFELRPGDMLSFRLGAAGGGCSIRVLPTPLG